MKTIEVSDETYEKIKDEAGVAEIGSDDAVDSLDSLIGRKLFVRTVTYHLVGHVVGILRTDHGEFLDLMTASWVADSGRFTQAIRDGLLNEVEPVGRAWVNVAAITDMFPWPHKLPMEQK